FARRSEERAAALSARTAPALAVAGLAWKQRPRGETRAYMRRLCAVIEADRPAVRVLTAAEEADRAISGALLDILLGAPYGYMTGARLADYRRVLAVRDALESA